MGLVVLIAMAQREDYFQAVRDVMRSEYSWFDQPNTIFGKIVTMYSVIRLLANLALIVTAMSQIYFYGMSYVVHDSFVLVPLGMIGIPVITHSSMHFRAILRTVNRFQVLIDSFPDHERDIIDKELMENRRKTSFIVKALDYYVLSTIATHFASITSHYFFGIPKKPVVLPLLFEKFLEGNLELRPILIFVVVISLVYIKLLKAFSGYVAVTLYVMKAPVAIMKALSNRLRSITEKAGKSSEKLQKSMVLGDIIKKHSGLLRIVHDMMSWNAFPLVYTTSLCTILFCLNALTFKQSMHKKEYSSAAMYGTFLLCCCAILYIICSQGQEIELESEELLHDIYGLPWYRESPKYRRDVVLMIVQGNRLMKLNYKGLSNINMVKYSDVLQTAYSYFTILSSVE